MSKRALQKIQSLVRSQQWIAGVHVQEYLEAGEFDERDLECSICTGTIRAIQRDELGEAVDRKKYVISGVDVCGLAFSTCGKIIELNDGQQYFFITAYKET